MEKVIVLGQYDMGNGQPSEAQDSGGVFHDLDSVATSLDTELSNIIVSYDSACLDPGLNGERKISLRRASMAELPLALPSNWSETPDPKHIYRFLPLGLSFHCSPGALLQLPNTTDILPGTALIFYMLDGDPPAWTAVLKMHPEENFGSEHGKVIVSDLDSRGISHFGKVSPGGYDSIGFLAHPGNGLSYSVEGLVLRDDAGGLPLGGVHVQLIDSNGIAETQTDTDGSYHFTGAQARKGIPGQRILVGAYLKTLDDGSWRSQSAEIAGSTLLKMPELRFPPSYETGTLTGYVRYDDGTAVGLGGLVTVRWIHPDNLDADSANDNPGLDILYAAQPVLNGGVFLISKVRATSGNRLEVFATEPLSHVRSAPPTRVTLQTGQLVSLNLVVERRDNVAPYIRNAYPQNGGFNFNPKSDLSIIFSEPLDEATLISAATAPAPSIRLLDRQGQAQRITHYFDPTRFLLGVTSVDENGAAKALDSGKRYTLELTTAITDRAPQPNRLAPLETTYPQGVAYRATFRTIPPDTNDHNECTLELLLQLRRGSRRASEPARRVGLQQRRHPLHDRRMPDQGRHGCCAVRAPRQAALLSHQRLALRRGAGQLRRQLLPMVRSRDRPQKMERAHRHFLQRRQPAHPRRHLQRRRHLPRCQLRLQHRRWLLRRLLVQGPGNALQQHGQLGLRPPGQLRRTGHLRPELRARRNALPRGHRPLRSARILRRPRALSRQPTGPIGHALRRSKPLLEKRRLRRQQQLRRLAIYLRGPALSL